MPFVHQGYNVSWSQYVANIIEAGDGQSHDDAIRVVLEYQAEKVIEKGAEDKTGYVLARFLRDHNPIELSAVVDPEHHTIFFGTEAEVRDQLA